jgi:ATP-dependent DNA ligase
MLFDDGAALYAGVCAHGLEGVVAKKLTSRYRPERSRGG